MKTKIDDFWGKNAQVVLQSLCCNEEAWSESGRYGLSDEHFPDWGAYRAVYQAMLERREKNLLIDLQSVSEHFTNNLKLMKGFSLADVTDCMVGDGNHLPVKMVSSYIQKIQVKAAQRKAIKDSETTLAELKTCEDVGTAVGILSTAFKNTINLLQIPGDNRMAKRKLTMYLNRKEQMATGAMSHSMIPTPFETLNRDVGGMLPGEVLGIVGLPSTGKSLIAKQMAWLTAEMGIPTDVYTIEMLHDEWMDRLVAQVGCVDYKAIRFGKMNAGNLKAFMNAMDRIEKAPLTVYDAMELKMTDKNIEAEMRARAKKGVKHAVIDYLQRVTYTGKKREPMDIEEISAMFKNVALEEQMNITVVMAENDDGKVRGSRAPSFDFDDMIHVCRNPKSEKTEAISVGKWRNGSRGYRFSVQMVPQRSIIIDSVHDTPRNYGVETL